MPVTATDVAYACGLSQPTVSLILNNQRHERFRPETIEAVFRTAERLGYRPNASAKKMRSGRSDTVGLLRSTRGGVSWLSASVMQGLLEEVARRDMMLAVSELPDEQLVNEGRMPRLLREISADGLVIAYTYDFPKKMLDVIDRYKIPAIWVNNKLDADCVYPDDRDAGRQATEYLLRLGHTKIAYVSAVDFPHFSQEDREAGYVDAMRAAGLSPRSFRQRGPVDLVGQMRLLGAVLDTSDRPTAVVTYSGECNGLLLQAALRGISVPGDLSIISIGNGVPTEAYVQVDTVQIPGAIIGSTAIDLLVKKIAAPGSCLGPVVIKCELVPGATCGPVAM
ncbi:MAG: LacI family transcriptional regulator [Phycisphaerae bacterium]|nr:MAG: LacI family transcriptional regulator [Phycisphaerae bacterium]